MLLVATEVRASPIQGCGLFAAEDIAAGTVICRWSPEFAATFTEEERATLPDHARLFLECYGWRDGAGNWTVSLDNSRFMNHSGTPNMTVTVTDECAYESRAARDIRAGEELTEDYRQFDADFDNYAGGWLGKPPVAPAAEEP